MRFMAPVMISCWKRGPCIIAPLLLVCPLPAAGQSPAVSSVANAYVNHRLAAGALPAIFEGNASVLQASSVPISVNMAGNWKFTGQSTAFDFSFSASGQITQDGGSLSGQFTISDSPCATSTEFIGTLSRNNLTMDVNENGQAVIFSGTVSTDGNSASGTYNAPSGGCTNGDMGTWTGDRLSGEPSAVILPQFAFGGGWYSALYFTNTGTSAVSFLVLFVGDDGTPLYVPSVGDTYTTVNLAPRGSTIIEAPNAGSLNQGYVSLSLPAGVVGYGVFRWSSAGRADQEAVVPFSSVSSQTTTLIWDDTHFVTAVAIVNPSLAPTVVSVSVRDTAGNLIGTSTVPLGANSKTATLLRNLPGLGTIVGNLGSADFTVNSGSVVALGLRADGPALTSIPTVQR
jgi:hypothetical protein